MNFNGQEVADSDIKSWLQGKTPDQIAQRALELGLNQSQIQQALQIGGINASGSDIANYTGSHGLDFGGAGGVIEKTPTGGATNYQQLAAANPGGMWIQGTYLTKPQIQEFYKSGGDDVQWLQQHGVTDLSQIHQLANQARDIDGTGAMSGDSALHHYYDMYKKYVPNGVFANDFNGFKADVMSDPARYGSIVSGTSTGLNWLTSTDSDFGGILGPGGSLWKPQHGAEFNGQGALGNGTGWTPVDPAKATPGDPYSRHSNGYGMHANADGTFSSYDPGNHTVYDGSTTGAAVGTVAPGSTPTAGGGTTGTPTTGGSGHTPGSSLVTTPGNYLGALGSAFTPGVNNPYQHIYRTDQMGPWMNYHADGLPSSAPITFHPQPESSFYSALQTPTRQTSPDGQVIQYAPGALTQSGV